jgi:endonuclease I
MHPGLIAYLLIVTLPFPSGLQAQLFPGLEGEELVDALRNAYRPAQLLTESQVKDTLYGVIFHRDDSVRCIYSGMSHDLPEGVDPSQWIYESGTEVTSMNLEHGWPQSKGAGKSTQGNRNMHHLYPSRTAINSDRADFPYSDISDPTTQKWYYLDMVQNQVPGSNIDAYSEFKKNVFEPRESVKGDIARAMMYFWTIYRADAEIADPDFFALQRESLCAWHVADPVDNEESLRSQLIATYQSGLENPFVLDCSLPKRTYCQEIENCTVGTSTLPQPEIEIILHPELDQLRVVTELSGACQVSILNLLGQLLRHGNCNVNNSFSYSGLSTGIFVISVSIENEHFVQKVFLY